MEAELGLNPSTVQGDVTDCDGREPRDEAWMRVRSGTRRAGPPETAIEETGKAEDEEGRILFGHGRRYTTLLAEADDS
jgi:hypothetical protein